MEESADAGRVDEESTLAGEGAEGLSTATHLTGVGAGPGNWRTPPEVFNRLNRVFQFDYDAFASHENALCSTYSTPEGTFSGRTLDGAPMFDCERDGLTHPWVGLRVFMNPPYGRGILAEAMAKAASERDNAQLIVALIPANTDTGWWHEYVKPYGEVHLLKGRIQFLDPETGKPGGSPPGGSAVVVYYPEFLR